MKNYPSLMFHLLGLAVLASLISGCGPGADLPCPAPDEELAAPSPGEERVAFTLQNDTCMSLCVLLLSPDHCQYMGGVNWVKDHPLHSEESVTVDLPPGKYAAWVEYCTEEFRADESLKVYSDFVHPVIDPTFGNTPPCETSLTVVNHSDVPICSLCDRHLGERVHRLELDGAEHIQPGGSLASDRTLVHRNGPD